MKFKQILLFALCCFSYAVNAQFSNKGTEFWVGYMAHRDVDAGLYLYITSDSSTTGVVSIPGKNWSDTFTVTKNAMTLVAVPPSIAHVTCTDCITDQGIKVVAAKPVVVYSHIYYNYRSDATLVLPTNTTGQEYYCMAYEQGTSSDRTEFIIVANTDNTKINITPSVDLRFKSNGTIPAKKTYTISLNAGQVYQAKAYSGNPSDDISGTYIQVIDTGKSASCKTVSVFSGSSWTSLGCTGSADNLYEQMYPVQSWGTRFATVPLKGVSSDNLRFLAAKDKTYVIILNSSGAPTTFYLDKGKYYDLKDVSEPKFVIADKPLMVAQYSKTQSCSGGISDPSMTIISPVEQTLTSISLYSSQYQAIIDHYINVVIPTTAKGTFRVDGNTASFTAFSKYPKYSYVQLKVTAGTHYLEASEGFLATAYGFGQLESYGYAAGANVSILKSRIDLKNSSNTNYNNICLGSKAVFNGFSEYTVKKWMWYFGDGTIDSAQNTTHKYKDTGLFRVKLLTYKSQYDGCKNFDSTILFIKVSGVPVAKYTHSLNCEGDVTFTDASIAPAKEKNDLTTWDFHSGTTEYSKTATKYYDTSGKFFMRMIVRTEAWCYDTLIDSIRINPKPRLLFLADKTCQQDSTYFKNLSTIPAGRVKSYTWNFGDGDSSFKNSPAHKYLKPGYYKVLIKAISDSSCVNSYSDSVFKYSFVNVNFKFRDTCSGIPLNFTNLTDTTILPITHTLWKTSLGDTAKTYHFAKSFNTAGKLKVTLIMEMDSFCKDSMVKDVVVFPVQNTAFSYSSPCANDSISFIDKSSISTGKVFTLSWDPDNSNTYYTSSVKVKYASPGAKKIHLRTISDKGCFDELKDTIILSGLQLNKLVFNDVCPNVEQRVKLNYSIFNDTVTKWNWNLNTSSFAGDSSVKISYNKSGKYILTLSVITKNGCKDKVSDSVRIFEDPKALFTIQPVCRGIDFLPKNISSIAGNDKITSYQWYYNGTFASNQFEPGISTPASGSQDITLEVISSKGCRDTFKLISDVYPLPVVHYRTIDTCLGQTASFNDNSSIASGTLIKHLWRFHDQSTAAGTSATKKYPLEGAYILTQVVTSDRSCIDSFSRNVSIHPLPLIDILPVNIKGCLVFTPDFANKSSIKSGTINEYKWTWGDGQNSLGFEPKHSYTTTGTYIVRLKATSDKGCIDSTVLKDTVIVYARPTSDFSFTPKQPSILESTLTFLDRSSADVTGWGWYFGDGKTDKSQNTSHTYTDTGNYTIQLNVKNANGCSDSSTQSFYINPDVFIFIPNSFSPNKDQTNDLFGVEGVVNGIKKFQMTIYNRWGEIVYSSNDPNQRWDGTYLGKEVPQGNYPYTILFQDFKETRWYSNKGVVQLLK